MAPQITILIVALALTTSLTACGDQPAEPLKSYSAEGSYSIDLTYLADDTVAWECLATLNIEEQRRTYISEDGWQYPVDVFSGTFLVHASQSCTAKSIDISASGYCFSDWCSFDLHIYLYYDFGYACEYLSGSPHAIRASAGDKQITLSGAATRMICDSVETVWRIRGTGTRN